MALDIRIDSTSVGEAIVRVRGELDLGCAGQLREAVSDLLNARQTKVIGLDLQWLTFVDSTGIGTLVVAHRICEQVGVELRLVAVSPFAAHVLKIVGVSEIFGVDALLDDDQSGSIGMVKPGSFPSSTPRVTDSAP
jgi:anti-anti-sigma factor